MNAKKAKRLKRLLKDAPEGTYKEAKRGYTKLSEDAKKEFFRLMEGIKNSSV